MGVILKVCFFFGGGVFRVKGFESSFFTVSFFRKGHFQILWEMPLFEIFVRNFLDFSFVPSFSFKNFDIFEVFLVFFFWRVNFLIKMQYF